MPATFRIKDTIENSSSEDIFVSEGGLRLGPGARITADTVIEPPIFIAAGARVLSGVSLGAYTYIGRNSIITQTSMGRYCSVAHDCQINYFRAHPTNWLSTHPFQYDSDNFKFWDNYALFQKRPFDGDRSQALVTIGPDVWIGAGAYIFGGLSIGAGAVIGARALVRSDVAAYEIAAGIPAVILGHRFPPEIVARLLALKWWDFSEAVLRELPFENVERCLDLLKSTKSDS